MNKSGAALQIVFCGDIMLGAEVGQYIGTASVQEWLQEVSFVWKEADLLIGNLESPCVLNSRPIRSERPELVFHAAASRLGELAAAGFSAVTLANNHVLNCGPLGLMETIDGLKKAGICHAGAGLTLSEAIRPAFMHVKGVTVGLVAFCYGHSPAGTSTPGVAVYERSIMRRALNAARSGADFVIAAVHDGLEYSDVPLQATRERFRFLAENGADIVVGHHPHVLQGLEWIGNVPVAYSLGDFLFHNSLSHVAKRNFARIEMGLYAPSEIERDPDKFSRGAMLMLRVSGSQKSVSWHPFRQDSNLRPRLCTGDTKREDLSRLTDLSAALLNQKDCRHALADEVMRSVRQKEFEKLGARGIIRLALCPKWRYFPRGLNWAFQRLKCLTGAR